MRELRNILTHEYPQKEEEIAKTLNKVKKMIFKSNKMPRAGVEPARD